MMDQRIERIYHDIRFEERQALSERIREAYLLSPRLGALDGERQAAMREVGSGKLPAEEGIRRLAALSKEERAILGKLGFAPDHLKLRYRCARCKDTGFLGGDRKKPCACRLKLLTEIGAASQINSVETFENFRTDVYPDEKQQKRTVKARELCEKYADALPSPPKPNLLFTGMAGLGKSYLGNAIAFRAVGRGIDAHRVTAYRFVQDVLSDIRENTHWAGRYQTVPLLVLDDLGSEPVIPNVSTEWLFTVVNERMLAARATVIITNLSFEDLSERYGERLASRFLDQRTTQVLALTGQDLRIH